MISYDEGICLEILNNLNYAVNDFYMELTREKENFEKTCTQNLEKLEKKKNSNAMNDYKRKRDSLINEFSICLKNHEDLSGIIEVKMRLLNEENKNSTLFVKEEFSAYSKLVSDSSKLLDKLSELRTFSEESKFSVRKGSENKKINNNSNNSYEFYVNLSNSIKDKMKKGENISNISDSFMPVSKFEESPSHFLKLNKIVESDNLACSILSNEKYLYNLNNNGYANFLTQLKSLSIFYSSQLDRPFLDKSRKYCLNEFKIDYSLQKSEWAKIVKLDATTDNFLNVEIKLKSELCPFPVLKFYPFIQNLFQDCFYKSENDELKIFGKTKNKIEIMNILFSETFKNSLKISSVNIRVFAWLEDLLYDNLSTLNTFRSNMREEEKNILKEKSKEFISLRKTFACLVIDQYRKDFPSEEIPEIILSTEKINSY